MLARMLVALLALAAGAIGQRAGAERVFAASRVRADAGCDAAGQPAFTARPQALDPGAAPSVYLGVWQPGVPDDMSQLDDFEHDAGTSVAIVMLWNDWASTGQLDPAGLCAIAERGAVPLITWMPTDWQADAAASRDRYSLDSIIAGKHDAYLTGWADQLAAYGGPVLLRFAHEMNGDWYAWGRTGNNTPDLYVRAWRHLHDLFVAEGATNVQWVWSPSVNDDGNSPFQAYYPGDTYVDWVALDGYNRGPQIWRWFTQVFGDSYNELTALTNKPLMIAEFASSEALPQQAALDDTKAKWITSAFTDEIPNRFPRVRAVVWFNEDKDGQEKDGFDWRIESSDAAESAFRQAILSPYYRTSWP